MTDDTRAIAAKVRGVASEYDLSQEAVAALIGLVDRKAVGARFQGRVAFTATELFRFARATGEPIERFFPPIPAPVSDSSPESGAGAFLRSAGAA